MVCPKCGFNLAMSQRICPRCKYCGEQDTQIGVTPPRSRRSSYANQISTRVVARLWRPRPLERRVMYSFAAIIPGLGHLLAGGYLVGLMYMALIGGLFFVSKTSFHEPIFAQMTLGFAATIHAYSIADLLPLKLPSVAEKRLLCAGFILVTLLAAFYVPSTEIANTANGRREMTTSGGALWETIGGFVLVGLLGVAAFAIASIVSTVISKARSLFSRSGDDE